MSETHEQSTGELVSQLSQQVSQLVRDELRLAQAEVAEKGKRAGLGVGLFSAAGVVGLFTLGAAIATAIIALSLAVDPWLAALIVTVVLAVVAGLLALVGRTQVSQATPPVPEKAVAGVKEDIATVKGQRR